MPDPINPPLPEGAQPWDQETPTPFTDDPRDRARAWAVARFNDDARESSGRDMLDLDLCFRSLAAVILEYLPGSDGALRPGAIAERERLDEEASARFDEWWSNKDARAAEHAAWNAANPGGTRERPICVESVRRVALARTDADEWCVVEHGGWTEDPGDPVNSFTMGYMDGANWYPSEAEARAAFAIASGQVDHGALVRLAAEHADEIAKQPTEGPDDT